MTRQYIFLDEAGNLDFASTGSRYFALTAISGVRPHVLSPQLERLRFDLLEGGVDVEYFHASNNNWPVRKRVLTVLADDPNPSRVDAVVIDKSAVPIELHNPRTFYAFSIGRLLEMIVRDMHNLDTSDIVVVTDQLPLNRKRKIMRGAIHTQLKDCLPVGASFTTHHHASKTCYGLQAADYYGWAIFRKWERNDDEW